MAMLLAILVVGACQGSSLLGELDRSRPDCSAVLFARSALCQRFAVCIEMSSRNFLILLKCPRIVAS